MSQVDSSSGFRGRIKDVTGRLIAVCIVASLGGLNFGYDNGWWGAIIGSPAFNERYGRQIKQNPDGTTSRTLSTDQVSLGSGLGVAGFMIGCVVAPFIMSRYGRRWTFIVQGLICIVGPLIQALSTLWASFAMILAGKTIVGVSMGIAAASISAYLAECCPASVRGFAINFYSFILNFGYLLSTITVYGVVDMKTSANWLIPICLQLPIPLIIVAVTMFLPESPRWLISMGRLDAAEKVMSTLSIDPAGAREQVENMAAVIEEEARVHPGNGWIEMWKGPNLRRTLIAIGMQCLQQAQGISFVASYLVLTFNELGFTNSNLILVGIFILYLFSSGLNFVLPDHFGRRLLLIGSALAMTACMFVFGGISGSFPRPTGALAHFLIAAYFVWIFMFAATWAGLTWIVSAEVSSQHLREKTLSVSAFWGFGVSLIINFVSPYIQNAGYGNLQGRIAFIWGGFSFVSAVFVYFFVPETAGRSLEELDVLFEAGVTTRGFARFDTTELLAQRIAPVATYDQSTKGQEESAIEKQA